MRRWTESIGWWQVVVCFVIAVYYAAVVAWAIRYTGFSFSQDWGADPEGFLFGDFLQTTTPGDPVHFVPGVLIPLVAVWAIVLIVMLAGVQKGIGATSVIFIPLLMLAFLALVVVAVTLPGAAQGLDSLFTPNWAALLDAGVWASAFGQIFFSLSVGFGIMITYASYVGRKTDMTGSGMVVGFSNSGFELLAGIGVFGALGFLAQAQGVRVDEVVASGLGLAFIAFPAIISEAPIGSILGVLFFGSLVLAGITSLISVIEVIIAGVRDKLALTRRQATLAVVLPSAILSILMFSTSSAVIVLDIVDHFINRFGILLVALVAVVVIGWVLREVPALASHLNRNGSIKLGATWKALVTYVAPAVLSVLLVIELVQNIRTPYEDYPGWMLGLYGWGVAGGAILIAIVLSALPWRRGVSLEVPSEAEEDAEIEGAQS